MKIQTYTFLSNNIGALVPMGKLSPQAQRIWDERDNIPMFTEALPGWYKNYLWAANLLFQKADRLAAKEKVSLDKVVFKVQLKGQKTKSVKVPMQKLLEGYVNVLLQLNQYQAIGLIERWHDYKAVLHNRLAEALLQAALDDQTIEVPQAK